MFKPEVKFAKKAEKTLKGILEGATVPKLKNLSKHQHTKKGMRPATTKTKLPRTRFQKLVNLMSSGERNKWAKAGYPGLLGEKEELLVKYITNYELRYEAKYWKPKQEQGK